MAKSSEARLRANARYANKTYSALTLRYRKEDEIFPLLERATDETGMSKAEYTKKALYVQFEKDGIVPGIVSENANESQDQDAEDRIVTDETTDQDTKEEAESGEDEELDQETLDELRSLGIIN